MPTTSTVSRSAEHLRRGRMIAEEFTRPVRPAFTIASRWSAARAGYSFVLSEIERAPQARESVAMLGQCLLAPLQHGGAVIQDSLSVPDLTPSGRNCARSQFQAVHREPLQCPLRDLGGFAVPGGILAELLQALGELGLIDRRLQKVRLGLII